MNKTELVNAVAEKAGLTKVDAKKAVDAAVVAVTEALAKNDKVALIGFGTLAVTERKARQGCESCYRQKNHRCCSQSR